mgnify:CR=1 FL=1
MSDTKDDWDSFGASLETPATVQSALPLLGGSAPPPVAMSAALKSMVAALLGVEDEIAALKEAREDLCERIASEARMPTDAVGEEIRIPYDGDSDLVVAKGERWSWDQDALKEMLSLAEDPAEIIDTSATIKRKTYEALSESQQDHYRHALTRKSGALKISIEKRK